jgi:thiamine biosynthesis lipoprotein
MRFASDTTFRSMGSEIRLIVDAPLTASSPSAAEAAAREQLYVEDCARRLSRFRPESELSAFNADRLTEVQASPLLRTMISAGLWAARISGGLVDPTLVDQIERVGYAKTREGRVPASLKDALAAAPPRRPAQPDPHARWRLVRVEGERGTVRRPPGVRIDPGGIAKGLIADTVVARLGHYRRVVVDCGGDIAIGGVAPQLEEEAVEVEHPLTGECVHTLRLSGGGVATSGLNVNVWRRQDGSYAHHLLDPATGEPAWTGLIGATAVGRSALEAETRAKTALLRGPSQARAVLAEHGGLIVHDSGDVELVGPIGDTRRGLATIGRGVG